MNKISPNPSFIISSIKSAIAQNSLSVGESFHALTIKLGFCADTHLSNHLLNLYCKSHRLRQARNLFDEMPEKNLISYSTLISSYARSSDPKPALTLMTHLHKVSILPNQFVFSSSIVACTKLNSISSGEQIHVQAVVSGFGADPFVDTALVDMYSKIGAPELAILVFRQCPVGDPALLNSMVSCYVSFGECEAALRVLNEARREFGFRPTDFSFGSLIKACVDLGKEVGEQIHGFIIRTGFDSNCFVGTALVDMYGGFGDLESLELIFGNVLSTDTALYNAIIVAYSKNGLDETALVYFYKLMLEGLKPNDCTFSSALKACGSLKCHDFGRTVHGLVEKSRFRQDLVVNTALINMYLNCGRVEDGCRLFDCMPEKNIITYNSMILGYGQNNHFDEAISLFIDMMRRRVDVDLATFVALMSSCSGCEWAVYVHAVKHGFGSDLMVQNALLDGLLKGGSAEDAREFFNKMKERNVVSWTTIISGLTHLGFLVDAIELFNAMSLTATRPNSFTFSTVFKACGSSANLNQGRCIHGYSIKHGVMDEFTNSSLLDMYAKCGAMEDCRNLFDRLANKDLVSWNTMITGYAQHGDGDEALKLYKMMGRHKVEPNHVTFVSLLSACSHCGLVEDGVQLFDLMVCKHGIEPRMEHCACMVDMFGRAGMLERARLFIKNMPVEADASVWTVFLVACKLHGDVELAQLAADHVVEKGGENNSTLVLLSNMYSEIGEWDDVEKARRRMGVQGMRKEPGLSWVQVS